MVKKLRGTTLLAGCLLLALLFFSTGAAPQVDDTSIASPKSFSRGPFAENRTAGEHSLPASPEESLFEAVIKWIKAGGIAKGERSMGSPLRVDPHPLRTGFDKSGGIMALDLKESDFAEADSAVLQRRRAVLQHWTVPERNAMTYYDECLMARDPRVMIDSTSTYEGPSERCRVLAVAISFPRPVSSIPEKGNCRDCASVQFVTLSPTSFQVYKLYVQRTSSSRGWKVIDRQNVNGITI